MGANIQTQPLVEVYSHQEIGELLTSRGQCTDVCFLVSIGDPEDALPSGYDTIVDKLRLTFPDRDDEDGASEEDVLEIIRAGKRVSDRSGRVLVHCWAGISRSSAAAIIMQMAFLGGGHETTVVESVIAQRPGARPNRRMIGIADRLLHLEGRLIAAVAEAVPRTD